MAVALIVALLYQDRLVQSILRRFLEIESQGPQAADAWRQLAYACHRSGDTLGEVHAFIERAQLADVPFHDVSGTANRFNALISGPASCIQHDEKQALASTLLLVMEARVLEADADDLSRMAWLAIHLDQEDKAQALVRSGLQIDPDNYHCQKLAIRLGVQG